MEFGMSNEGLDMYRGEKTLQLGGKDFVGEEKVLEDEEVRAKDDSGKIAEEIDAQSPIDRLSALPDSILVEILSSFKSMKEVAITAVLSKRWRTLWADLPSLKFRDQSKEVEARRKFVCLVNRALRIRSIDYLEIFDVKLNFSECFASDVDGWIDFAFKNRVKEVKLQVCSGNEYTLPQMMYSNSSMTRLKLCRCIVAPEGAIEWQYLTRLQIERVNVPQQVIEKILSCSPVLNNLSLILCWGFYHLDVNCPSLCELTVTELPFLEDVRMLQISAPYLRFLAVSIYKRNRMLKLKNIQSLAGAFIDIYRDELIPGTMDNMKEVFENIGHAEELKLGLGTSKVLPMLRLPESRLRRLEVRASRDEQSFSAIARLLESSPEVEELTIDGCDCEGATDQGPVIPVDLDRDLLHLETVEIRNFAEPNGEPLLTAARILLKRAPMLKKMVIKQELFEGSTDFEKTAQTLSGYPRSSREATLILRHRSCNCAPRVHKSTFSNDNFFKQVWSEVVTTMFFFSYLFFCKERFWTR